MIITLLLVLAFIIFPFYFMLHKRKIYIWLPYYFYRSIRNLFIKTKKPLHIMFCFVDHFEPHVGNPPESIAEKRVRNWLDEYPNLAKNYIDSDGNILKHTWFYPIDEMKESELEQLSLMCKEGLGEIELHLHHKNDTADSLKAKLNNGLAIFNKYGINKTIDNKVKYAFIHGNWALDNSIVKNGENFCGVNNELQVLSETGCFADFTFPAYMQDSQPAMSNTIYFAKDEPNEPKSYNWGKPIRFGERNSNYDLMIIQGPLMLNWQKRKYGIFPNIEDGNIHKDNPYFKLKTLLWLKSHIHIFGKPEWVFVKIFTHGADEKNHKCVLGEDAIKLFDEVISEYKNEPYRYLHFVTAREMYNIIRAAEDGKTGNPNEYRDYEIKSYQNTVK